MIKTFLKTFFYACLILIVFSVVVTVMLDIAYYAQEPTVYEMPKSIEYANKCLEIPYIGNIIKHIIGNFI